jgi:uncharacterized RDD family membrane protein YckC
VLLVRLLILLLAASVAAAQDESETLPEPGSTRIVALHAAGTTSGELLAISFERGVQPEERSVTSQVRRRAAAATLDDWEQVATYTRRIRALAASPDGEVVVLLDPADATTRPARMLRVLSPGSPEDRRVVGSAWSETIPPKPPADLILEDVLYLDGRLAVIARGGAIWVLDDEWTLAEGVTAAPNRVRNASQSLQFETTDDLTKLLLDDKERGEVQWRLPEGLELASDDLVAAAEAAGTLRLTRAVTAASGDMTVVRLNANPDGTPRLVASQRPEAQIVGFQAVGLSPLASGFRLLLYGLLVIAFIGMLLQGRRPAVAPSNAKPSDVPPLGPPPIRLRLAAASVDLLPLVFGLGIVTGDQGVNGQTANTVILLAGIAAYVLLPLVGELAGGRSPGKAIFGLRVRRVDHAVPDNLNILIRNLVRPVDLLGGWMLIFFQPQQRRLGDLAAGTVVVYEPVGSQPVETEAAGESS